MENNLNRIYEYIDQKEDEMLKCWEDIVNLESHSSERDNINTLAEHLKKLFEDEGLDCRLIDVGEESGKTLIGTLGDTSQDKPIIFSGHMDTVFPSGTFGDNPFGIKNGKAYGPGVLDMKGGIVIILYTIKALNSIGYDERPIKVILSGDEETGHINSEGAEVIIEESKDGFCGFNMETGLIDNSICIGRKGRIGYEVTVRGVGAHAGNDFENGINAIEEMAHKILDLQELTDLKSGTTVSVSIVEGGTINNAIPEKCRIEIDIRFEKLDEMEKIKNKIEEVCNKTYLDGTETEGKVLTSMAPYETTDGVLEFYEFCNKISKEYGFGDMDSKRLGGSSDAAYLTIGGTPALCSFGVKGQWNHTADEYALVNSLFERAKFISTIILNLEEYK